MKMATRILAQLHKCRWNHTLEKHEWKTEIFITCFLPDNYNYEIMRLKNTNERQIFILCFSPQVFCLISQLIPQLIPYKIVPLLTEATKQTDWECIFHFDSTFCAQRDCNTALDRLAPLSRQDPGTPLWRLSFAQFDLSEQDKTSYKYIHRAILHTTKLLRLITQVGAYKWKQAPVYSKSGSFADKFALRTIWYYYFGVQ